MSFTCLTCRAVFSSAEEQRAHYQSDWHRYNLKRKVVGLEPITLQEFESKLQQIESNRETEDSSNDAGKAKSKSNKKQNKTSAQKPVKTVKTFFDPATEQLRCSVTNKTFNSVNALNSHLRSTKHAKAMSAFKNTEKYLSCSSSVRLPPGLASMIETDDLWSISLEAKEEKRPYPVEAEEHLSAQDFIGDDDWESDGEVEVLSDEWEEEDDDETMSTTETECNESTSEQNPNFITTSRGHKVYLDAKKCLFSEKVFPTIDDNLVHMAKEYNFYLPYPELIANTEKLLNYLQYKIEVMCRCIYCNKRFRDAYSVRAHMTETGHTRMGYETPELFLEYVDFYTEPDEVEPTSAEEAQRMEDLIEAALADDFALVTPSGVTIGHRALHMYYKQRSRRQNWDDLPTQKQVEDSRNDRVGIRSTQNKQVSERAARGAGNHYSSKDVMQVREMKAIQRYQYKAEKVKLKANSLKTHSRDQTFWNMRY